MLVRFYRQSWYKYRIRICARALICRDLRDRVVDGGGWSDSHTGWTKVHLSITQASQTNIANQNLGELVLVIGSRYRFVGDTSPTILFSLIVKK